MRVAQRVRTYTADTLAALTAGPRGDAPVVMHRHVQAANEAVAYFAEVRVCVRPGGHGLSR